MRFEKKIEIVNLFIIQVKISTFVPFQLNIDENHLKVNKKLTSFWGPKVLFKKIEFEQKVRVFNGKNLNMKKKNMTTILPILKSVKNCSLDME